MIQRRAALAAIGTALAAPALAQGLPRPAHPAGGALAPGGPTDAHGRVLAELASRKLGQPVVVENKAGASGTLGALMMAQERTRRRLPDRADADHRLPPAGDVAPAHLRPAGGFHLHHPPDRLHFRRGGAGRPALEDLAGIPRLCEGQSGQGHLRHARCRHLAAHHHGTHRRAAGHRVDCTCPSAAAPTTSRRCCSAARSTRTPTAAAGRRWWRTASCGCW